MTCPKCGSTLPDGADRCTYCNTVFAAQTFDPNWRKGLLGTGKNITGMVFGIVLLAALFPLNAFIALVEFVGGDDTTSGLVFTAVALTALAGGLVLLLINVKKLKAANRHNAKLTESHRAEIEAEKAARERARQQQLQVRNNHQMVPVMNNWQTPFNAGTTGRMLFELNGTFSVMQVYEDRVILIAKTTARSYVAGKFFNGTKEFFFDDLINVQFREATGMINGYLQFDYPGAVNISNSRFGGAGGNYSSENSFIFDINVRMGASVLPGENPVQAANRIVSDAYRYIHGRIMEEKKAKKTVHVTTEPSAPSTSAADEIKKLNELLKEGAISQEEFDELKKKYL